MSYTQMTFDFRVVVLALTSVNLMPSGLITPFSVLYRRGSRPKQITAKEKVLNNG
jgi:hypothetical protein